MNQILCSSELILFYFLGNEVDQLFSILATEFKSEILTVDDLKDKILNAPIVPKPTCRTLWYIFGWNKYITDHLADPQLQNHSRYNSFLISQEDGQAKLRAKRLPQHTLLVPRAGIRLLKEGHNNDPVGPAEFRCDNLKFDEINKGLRKYLSTLDLEKRMTIQTSWDSLRSTLEALPRRSENLVKMNIADLPQQVEDVPAVPDQLQPVDEIPELLGDLFPEEICDGQLGEEVVVGMDVVIYTDQLKGRPWVGRITELLGDNQFKLQWFVRKSIRSRVFTALNNSDGSPSLAELDHATVMFWMMSEPQSRTATSFSLSPYWLETISREYASIDD